MKKITTILSISALCTSSLAIGYFAKSSGGNGTIFIPDEQNQLSFVDLNLNGIPDRYALFYDGVELDGYEYFGSRYLRYAIDTYDLYELESGLLSLHFQELDAKDQWLTIDQTPVIFDVQIVQDPDKECDYDAGNVLCLTADELQSICEFYDQNVEGYIGGTVQLQLLNYSNYQEELDIVRVQAEIQSYIEYEPGDGGCEEIAGASVRFTTTNESYKSIRTNNRYKINELQDEVQLLWEYLDAIEKCNTDVNHDNVVNVSDLLEVISDWGSECQVPKGSGLPRK